ncbi:MAG: hypothetical protein ACE5IR_05805 [bacterium]
MPTQQEIEEEQRKIRRLRTIVDLTTAILQQGNYSAAEAQALVAATKKSVVQLFPGAEEPFDLIYKPRFERIIKERIYA